MDDGSETIRGIVKSMRSGKTSVCVLTARGMAAISSVALAGPDAQGILEKVFQVSKSTAKHSLTVPPNQTILHGAIIDNQRVIDEVVVGREGADTFVIHCHGNPLLVEQIVRLVQSQGAILADAESFAFSNYKQTSTNLIETEAKLAMQKSATVLGVKILQAQICSGLSRWATETLSAVDSLDPEDIKKQCSDILERSKIAQRIIEGVRIVIAGPPNSGKSTLLNCLAGQQQVIVSDTAGTTRDWVSITARLGDGMLRAEFIDTAGLDDALADKDSIERTAQEITRELLESCDLILYVQDITEIRNQKSEVGIDTAQPVIYVNNKCDLIQEHKNARIQEHTPVSISAKDNQGINQLAQRILDQLGVTDFDITKPIAFTQRQRDLLLAILKTDLPLTIAMSKLLCPENCF